MLDPKNKIHSISVCLFAMIVLLALWKTPGETPKADTLTKNQSNGAYPDAIIKTIKSEKQVLDVYYDPSASIQWHIGVKSDGSKRYGFAVYICEHLQEHNLVSPHTSVRIVDISEVMQGKSFRKASLGRVNCSTYSQAYP